MNQNLTILKSMYDLNDTKNAQFNSYNSIDDKVKNFYQDIVNGIDELTAKTNNKAVNNFYDIITKNLYLLKDGTYYTNKNK